MFYSLVTLIRKVTASLTVPVVGLILEFTGYASNSAEQPTSAILGIRVAVGPIPAVLLCAGIVFAILYPLTRSEYARAVEELARRRMAAGEEAL
jgi:GPH family glycoside/pentoside/hexuronide:cation symporter